MRRASLLETVTDSADAALLGVAHSSRPLAWAWQSSVGADARADLLERIHIENYFDCCSLSTGPYVYGLWVKRISQLHPPAAPGESAGNPVPGCRQHVAFCRVLFRCAGSWRTAVALRLLR